MVWKISLWWEEKRKWRLQVLTALSSFALWKSARAAGRRGLVEHISPSKGVWDGWGCWGQAGLGAGSLCSQAVGVSLSVDVHVNYLVSSRVTFQSVSAIYLTAALLVAQAQEVADLRLARTTVVWISGCCSGLPLVGVSVSWIQLPLTSVAWGTLATSVRPLCLSVFIARALCRCQEHTFPPAPPLSCSALIRPGAAHAWGYCLLPHPLSTSEGQSDFSLKHFYYISLQISFLYDHQLLILFSACLF